MKSTLSNQQIDRIFNVLPGEGFLVRNLFFHNFFQGTGIAFFYTASHAIFLDYFSVQWLPWIYLASALLLMSSGRIFAHFEHRLQIKSLMNYVVLVLLLTTILFYFGLTIWNVGWIIFLLLAFYRVLYTLNSLEFWGLSSLAFDVRQSKRLFPLIGAGDIPAKLLGYLSLIVIVPYTGTEALLLFASGSFLLSFIFLNQLLSNEDSAFDSQDPYPDFSVKSSAHAEVIWKSLFKSRYLFWISIFAIAGMFTLALLDYSFLSEVKYEFKNKEDLAQFFGMLFAIGYGLTMIIKFFLSGRIIERLGVAHAAFILPVFLLLSGILAVIAGIFSSDQSIMLWIFSGMYVGVNAIRYSIDDPNMMTLFQPLSKSLRLFGHTLIKSVMQPLGLIVSGAMLLVFLNVTGSIDLIYVSAIFIGASALLIILTDRVNYHYVVQLQEAIRTRYFEGSTLEIFGERARTSLEERLRKGNTREAIHSLELLSRKPPDHWADILESALDHGDPEVRTYAIRLIHEHHVQHLKNSILDLLEEDASNRVREAAIRSLPALDPDHIDRIYPYLNHEDRSLRKSAYIALLDSGYLEAVVRSGRELLKLMESNAAEDRSFICQVLGELGQHNHYKFLMQLLDDLDQDVRRQAIIASAGVSHPSLLNTLFSLMDQGEHIPELVRSISSFGDQAVAEIEDRISTEEITPDTRVIFCRILSKINGDRADDLLISQLEYPLARVRNSALYGLHNKQFRTRERDRANLAKFFQSELDLAFEIMHAEHNCPPDTQSMLEALQRERRKVEDRILIVLSFQYDPVRIQRARESLYDQSTDIQARSLELLEYELPRSLYHPLSLLFGKKRQDEHLNKYVKHYSNSFSYPEDWRRNILESECKKYSRWTIAMAMYTLDETDASYVNCIRPLLKHNDLLIREEAQRYLASHEELPDKKSKQMTTNPQSELLQIEKVLLLKSTSMFQQIPEHILVDVAKIASETELAGGETLFKKGDFGDRMYIIVSGSIKIHDGDHVFSRLGDHDIFGELALLDPEPRSASATAEEDCTLLYIGQDPFYELMSTHPEVAKGILTILGRRLRAQNEQIVEMKQKAKV